MKSPLIVLAAVALGAAWATTAMGSTMATLRGQRRILLIVAPAPYNPDAVAQGQMLAGWTKQASDRDISVVRITAGRVTGVSDGAASLSRRYRIRLDLFQVLLIGKDGTVALRSARPLAAQKLQSAIDAMPMRMAGER